MSLNIERLPLTTKDRYLKLIIVLFCIREKARIWTHRNYSLDLHPNYLGPVSRFFHPESLS